MCIIDDVTVHELLLQYEGRIGELRAGLEQARFHSTLAAVVLAVAFALFLMLSLLAIRQRIFSVAVTSYSTGSCIGSSISKVSALPI